MQMDYITTASPLVQVINILSDDSEPEHRLAAPAEPCADATRTTPNTVMDQLGMRRWWRAVQDQTAPTAQSKHLGMLGCRFLLMHQRL